MTKSKEEESILVTNRDVDFIIDKHRQRQEAIDNHLNGNLAFGWTSIVLGICVKIACVAHEFRENSDTLLAAIKDTAFDLPSFATYAIIGLGMEFLRANAKYKKDINALQNETARLCDLDLYDMHKRNEGYWENAPCIFSNTPLRWQKQEEEQHEKMLTELDIQPK